jgi:hypothetical protein
VGTLKRISSTKSNAQPSSEIDEVADEPGGPPIPFSAARFSSLPGMPFPGDPERYPVRDEVVAYAHRLDTDVRWNQRAVAMTTAVRNLSPALFVADPAGPVVVLTLLAYGLLMYGLSVPAGLLLARAAAPVS